MYICTYNTILTANIKYYTYVCTYSMYLEIVCIDHFI